jgi:hypothetical protein
VYGRLEWKAGKTYEVGLDSSANLVFLEVDEYEETRRTAQEVGRWDDVRRGVMPLVVRGGRGGGEDAAAFMGGDMVGGDAVMAAIFALLP